MTDGQNCDAKTQAVLDANDLLDRMEEHTLSGLKPGGDADDALGNIAEELETSPEAERIRDVGERPFKGVRQDSSRDLGSDQAIAEAEAESEAHPS